MAMIMGILIILFRDAVLGTELMHILFGFDKYFTMYT